MFKKVVAGLVISSAILLGAGMGNGEGAGMGKGNGGEPQGNMNNAPMAMYQSVDKKDAELLMKGESKEYCPNCGMYLPKYYKTNHALKLKSGEVRQYCSIYCLVEETELTVLRDKKDEIEQIMVVDVPTLKFIDAKEAFYVVGSNKPGTMGATSEYAFAKKEDAEKFAKENGGEVKNYEQTYENALKNFAKDTAYVYKKRSTNMYGKGEKLYNEKCDKEAISKIDAHTMADMKAMIKDSKACGEGLNDGELQAIMLYYWDKKLANFEKLFGKNQEIQKYIKEMEAGK